MPQNKHRLSALDGLRGFAIILVFLNHIPTAMILNVIPQWLFAWFFINGVTGVTFLFILSGFLMYYIYPVPTSELGFLQKRYTRIFPLFLTMSAVMFTGRQLQNASWLYLLAILATYPLVTNVIWKTVKKLPKLFGSTLFLAFLALQTGSGLFYVFWINKHSFAQFSALPTIFREGIIYVINATLTLPLGQYIPMLDGVYWSLASEVLFYVLYPILVTPLITFLLPKPLKVKIAFLVVLFFLLGGIHLLSYKIYVLSLVQPALFFYFTSGITLAHLYKHKHSLFEKLSSIFSGKLFLVPLLLGFLTVMTVHDLSFLGQWISPWVRMIFALPITFCVAILLAEKTVLQKVFSSKWLMFLGMVSYSIYLSHALVIHIAELLYVPVNLVTTILFILVVFATECAIAYFLYTMLEAPYFIRDKHTLPTVFATRKIKIDGKLLFPIICIVYLLGIFAAYQSKDRFNFFSLVVPLSKSHFTTPKLMQNQSSFIVNSHIFANLELSATSNDFGLLSLQLSHKIIKNNPNPQALLFTLTQKGSSQPLVMSTYSLDQFNNGEDFPFGFPNIPDAKGKTYIASFSATNQTSGDFVSVNANSAKAVYSANKKTLLTHPKELIAFMWSKIEAITNNHEAQLVLIFALPFVMFTLFVFL